MQSVASILEVLKNMPDKVLVFLFLLALILIPGYMAYRNEQAINRNGDRVEAAVSKLAEKMECGQKIRIATAEE